MRLLDRYSAVLANFQHAVHEMRSRLTSADEQAFQRANTASERLRLECEQARIELDAHVMEHGCGIRTQTTLAG